jgi:molybdenum cofactor synthesis domain-containing protein
LISYEEARARVVGVCRPLDPVPVSLDGALGRVLAERVVAAEDVPPFANTAMDGYAVHAADIAGASPGTPCRLRAIGTLAAGAAANTAVGHGEALRIMTGAPFPDGADAIAIVEVTEVDGDDVLIRAPSRPGDHIRAAGEDIGAGSEVFAPGTVLGPGHLGVLASAALAEVSAHPRVRVGVLSTGDELVTSGPLRPGQIRDSNRRALLGLLRRDGFDAVDLGIARDDEAVIREALTQAAAGCDAVITSGGVSMGDFDYVKKVLDEIGDMAWMQVAIRPAKPLAFGLVADAPVFGLPGNPVSSMVSYELFARPALRRMSGHLDADLDRPTILGVTDSDMRRRPDGRVNYLRVVASFAPDGRCHVASAGGQGSHQLLAMAVANALAVVPSGPGMAPGDDVDVMLLQ